MINNTKTNRNHNRYTKKQECRRKVIKEITDRNDYITRKILIEQQIEDMIFDIKNNNVANFGLLKLSNLNLDKFYLLDDNFIDTSKLQYMDIIYYKYKSLMSYAIELNRDRIIYSLIRAGVNPMCLYTLSHEIINVSDRHNLISKVYNVNKINVPYILQIYSQYPPAYMVWIVKLLHILTNHLINLKLLSEYAVVDTTTTTTLVSVECCLCTYQSTSLVYGDDITYMEICNFLQFIPCNHIVCHACYWKNIHLLDSVAEKDTGSDLEIIKDLDINTLFNPFSCCIVCRQNIIINEFYDKETIKLQYSNTVTTSMPSSIHYCLRSISQARWDRLPSSKKVDNPNTMQQPQVQYNDSATQKCNKSNEKFQALSLSACVSEEKYIGLNKEERFEQFLAAVIRGGAINLRRVAILIEAGIEIDRCDEYGLTALIWASYHGHLRIVQLLIKAGATIDKKNPLGYNAYSAAKYRKHALIIRLLTSINNNNNNNNSTTTEETIENDSNVLLLHTNKCNNFTTNTTINNSTSTAPTILSTYQFCLEFNPDPKKSIIQPQQQQLEDDIQSQCKEEDSSNNSSRYSSSTQSAKLTILIPIKSLLPLSTTSPTTMAVHKEWESHGVVGAEMGAFCIDHSFSDSFLNYLLNIYPLLPIALSSKPDCPSRSYFCDISNIICETIETIVKLALLELLLCNNKNTSNTTINNNIQENDNTILVKLFPQMRFLHYTEDGSSLEPHVDLARTNVTILESSNKQSCTDAANTIQSTHTLILYLTTCHDGGGTSLLRSLKKSDLINNAVGLSSEILQSNSNNNSSSNNNNSSSSNNNIVSTIFPYMGRLLLFPHNCPHEGLPIHSHSPKLLLRGEIFLSLL